MPKNGMIGTMSLSPSDPVTSRGLIRALRERLGVDVNVLAEGNGTSVIRRLDPERGRVRLPAPRLRVRHHRVRPLRRRRRRAAVA